MRVEKVTYCRLQVLHMYGMGQQADEHFVGTEFI
jgi:hypothetical protein